MRIIGTIDHPVLKITVFKMDNKLSVKFETGLYEQTYKFREDDNLKDFESVKSLIDQSFISFVLEQFEKMHRAKNEAYARKTTRPNLPQFEEII